MFHNLVYNFETKMLGKMDDAVSSLKIKPKYSPSLPPPPPKKSVEVSAPVYTKITRVGWGRGYQIRGMGVL